MSKGGAALNRFLRGTKRLSQLYDFSMHCYSHVTEDLEQRLATGEIRLESHITSQHGFVQHHRVANTLQHAKDYFPKELRSVILVRLVSEFEVFFISQIREAAVRAEQVFRGDITVEWPRAKLVAFDSMGELRAAFVSADCRNLSSAGFDEMCKYYKKYLGIDVCPPNTKIDDIREVHARRHLHVHGQGIVDDKYIRDFGSNQKSGTRLTIDDQYLRKALALLRAVAAHVATEAAAKYPEKKGRSIRGKIAAVRDGEIFYLIRGRFRGAVEAAAYLDPDRPLGAPDGPKFGDLLVWGSLKNTYAEWTIIGNPERLKAYFIDLRDAQARGMLRLTTSMRLTPK